jgi:hypothetical protein
MIAGMKGLGMEQTPVRRVWVTARRTAVAVATAAVIVLIGSRVNRESLPFTPGQPRVADQVLAEVRLDERSLASVAQSINASAGRQRVRLDTQTLTADDLEEGWVGPGPQRLRNVRLGRVLAIGAARDDVEWREEAGEIVIGGKGTASLLPDARAYDVGDLVDDARAWSDALGGAGGPASGAWSAKHVVGVMTEVVYPQSWNDPATGWRAEGLGRWLYVCASEAGHRKVERFLAMMRRGDSGPVAPAGGER